MIADGKIKLKNDSQIKSFTETGLLFEDGSQLPADVVVFATGYVFSTIFGLSHSVSGFISDMATPKSIFGAYVVTRWPTDVRLSGTLTRKES